MAEEKENTNPYEEVHKQGTDLEEEGQATLLWKMSEFYPSENLPNAIANGFDNQDGESCRYQAEIWNEKAWIESLEIGEHLNLNHEEKNQIKGTYKK